MQEQVAVTRALRRTWAGAGGLLVLALLGVRLESQAGLVLAELGLVLAAAAGGTTAARGSSVGPGWNLLAWFVPASPVLVALVVFAWLESRRADPMAVVVLYVFAGAAAIVVWATFGVAAAVELARRRRRRFGTPRAAWENGPTPPSYS